MSDWRDGFRQAPLSFRGVRMTWNETVYSGGFYNDKKTYPTLGAWDVDSISEVPESFAIKAKLLGDDYLEKKELLIGALRTPGEGELVIPGAGSVMVLVAKWKFKEVLNAKGMADVEISFDRKAPEAVNFIEVNLPKAVLELSDEMAKTTTEVVASSLETSPFKEIKKAFGAVFDALLDIAAHLQGKKGPLASILSEIDSAKARLDTLAAIPSQMVESFFSIAKSLTEFVQTVKSFALMDPVRSALESFRRLSGHGISLPGKTGRKTATTRLAEHTTKVVALYGSSRLLNSLDPWSEDDGADYARALTALSQSALGDNAAENEAITALRIQGVYLLRKKIQGLGLSGEKSVLLTENKNALAISSTLKTSFESLKKINRPENLFFLKGRVRYV